MTDICLSARNVTKRYPMGERVLHVLHDVSLDIRRGEILIINGPSGAGKSTLLHILGLLDQPTAGDVLLDGEDVAQLSGWRQSKLRNLHFGFIFQFYHLLPELNALENVCLPRMIQHGIGRWWGHRKRVREQAASMLDRVGLGSRMSHRPSQLSGGERQRVAIARALVNEPRIVLCDEPTGNLDRENGLAIQDLLWELNEKYEQTLVIVTHDELMAARGHRTLHMVDGRIQEAGESQREPADGE